MKTTSYHFKRQIHPYRPGFAYPSGLCSQTRFYRGNREFTINQALDWILGQIVREEPDLVGSPVTSGILRPPGSGPAAENGLPHIQVWCWGPEVTPDPEGILLATWADFAVLGRRNPCACSLWPSTGG